MKCVMTSGTFGSNPNYASYGLEPGHAYSLLKVYDITHPTKGELTLLKIRNPWGNKEWNGDWSDGSNLWTEELKE
jgi:calpain-15